MSFLTQKVDSYFSILNYKYSLRIHYYQSYMVMVNLKLTDLKRYTIGYIDIDSLGLRPHFESLRIY